MSSKILQIFSLTYIPVGISLWYGESHTTRFSLRKMRSHLGAKAGNERTAKGLPEVQKPILEHSAKEVGPALTEPTWLVRPNGRVFQSASCQDAFQLAACAAQVKVYSYRPSSLFGPALIPRGQIFHFIPCSDYRVSTGVLLGRVSTGGVCRTGEGLFIDPLSHWPCVRTDMGPTLFCV